MSSWERRFDDHALWTKLATVESKLGEVEAPDDEDKRDTLNYAIAALELALARRDGTPPLQITQAMLDGASTTVDTITSYLDYWVTGQYSDEQMDQATEGLIAALASWPPLTADQTAKAHRKASREITRVTEDVLAQVGEKRDSLVDALDALQTKVSGVESAVSAQQSQLDSTISTFENDNEEAKNTAVNAWEEERTNQRKQAEDGLQNLATLEKEARDLVHAATGSVVATDYGEYAKQKNRAAWSCDIAAAVIGAAGVGAILFHLYNSDTGADGDVGLSLTRLAASLGTLGIAALVAHRGHDHHTEARAAKRTDLAIRRVGPFTANLAPDVREQVTVELADRIFIRGELDDVGTEKAGDQPSLWERIQQYRKDVDAGG